MMHSLKPLTGGFGVVAGQRRLQGFGHGGGHGLGHVGGHTGFGLMQMGTSQLHSHFLQFLHIRLGLPSARRIKPRRSRISTKWTRCWYAIAGSLSALFPSPLFT